MDDIRIHKSLDDTDVLLTDYLSGVSDSTALVRKSVRDACVPLKEEVSMTLTSCEVRLARAAALIAQSAEYHILSAYYSASPGLWAILMAIYGVVMVIIDIVNFINDILTVITGESLAY